MTVESSFLEGSNTLTISVSGKFDYSLVRDFRQAYDNDVCRQARIVIDLRDTDYMASSALGMLLSMQQHLEKPDGAIGIVNCSDYVKKILAIVRFDKKFNIS